MPAPTWTDCREAGSTSPTRRSTGTRPGPRAGHLALRWLGKSGEVRDFTYGDLGRETARFANVLAALGVAPGDLVGGLAGRIPELYIGGARHAEAPQRLQPALLRLRPGADPARGSRSAHAKVLVTTELLYRRKVAGIRATLPELEHVILIGEGGAETDVPGTHDYGRLMAAAADTYEIGPTDPEDAALVHFTSGTTGTPKGAVHVHGAIVSHAVTGKLALDLHPDDVFWCTADPGWVTGTSYGIISPLANGVTMIVDEAEFDAERWYGILERRGASPSGTRRRRRSG